MKIVYKLNRNISQFSYIYNIYKILNGPIFYKGFQINYKTYPTNIPKTRIIESIEELIDYNPDFILYTDYDLLWEHKLQNGNWKNIYIGHGISTYLFDDKCNFKDTIKISSYGLGGPYHLFDYILVQSKLMKNSFMKILNVPENKIKIIGLPRMDNINKLYFINYNNKKNILYAPSWNITPSLLIMKDIIIELSKYFNIYVIYHSNILKAPNSQITENAKFITKNKSSSLKIIFREEYSSLFEGLDKTNIINNKDSANILQQLVLSCDFTICDTSSGVFWDALYFNKPFLKVNSTSQLSLDSLINDINSIQPIKKINHCDKEYSLNDILGNRDNLNSQRCINILKSLI